MPVEAEPAAETGGLSDEDYLALRKALSSEGLAWTSSARERAATRALAAEAGWLDTQTALDARELQQRAARLRTTQCLTGGARLGTHAGVHSLRTLLPELQRAVVLRVRRFACGRRVSPVLLYV